MIGLGVESWRICKRETMRYICSLVLILFQLSCSGGAAVVNESLQGDSVNSESSEILDTTLRLSLNAVLPVDESEFVLSSVFGPRLKASENSRDDFHRGIDIPGALNQNLYAIANGVLHAAYVEGSSAYPNGGNVVVIRHELSSPIQFQGKTVHYIYAHYLHLNSFGDAAEAYLASGVKQSVSQGEIVGGMGQSGTTSLVHLHFEIRLETTCSLEYQLENSSASCAQYGFDPHVNPMILFQSNFQSTDYTLTEIQHSSSSINFEVTANRNALNVDGLSVNVFSDANLTQKIFDASLSYDLRTGFDASSTETLDDFDLENFVVTPATFGTDADLYSIEFTLKLPSAVWEGRNQIFYQADLLTTEGVGKSIQGSLQK